MSPDDLMKYAIPIQDPSRTQNNINPNQSNDLMRYAIPVEETSEEQPEISEAIPAKIVRVGVQNVSRGLESVLGLPGDIQQSVRGLITAGAEKIAGKELPYLRETPEAAIARRKRIPTSAELRETSEKLTKGYTKPQSELEETLGDFTSKVATSTVGGMGILRSLGAAAGGQLLKQGVKFAGGSESAQQLADFGGSLLFGAFDPKGAAKYSKELYKRALSRPETKAIIPTVQLASDLSVVKDKLISGIPTPQKTAVLNSIKDIESKIAGGNIELKDLIEIKQDVNQIMGDPEILKRGKTLFPQVVKALNKTIDSIEKTFPEFHKEIRAADLIYGGLKQSEKSRQFIEKVASPLAKHHKKSPLVALGLGLYFGGPKGALIAGSLAGGVKSYEFLSRLKNPEIRKFYINATKDALNENKAGVISNLTKLGREVEKTNQDSNEQ